MKETIFTKIIKGEIPAHKIYEDEHTLAFLDIHPITEGHTLVVSKKQVEFLWDLDDETYQAVMATAKRVALHLRQTLSAPYVGLQVVGTDVPHVHVHLIPFRTAAEFHGREHMEGVSEPESLAALAEKIKMN
jgi:histidine triad (HIT) family protein